MSSYATKCQSPPATAIRLLDSGRRCYARQIRSRVDIVRSRSLFASRFCSGAAAETRDCVDPLDSGSGPLQSLLRSLSRRRRQRQWTDGAIAQGQTDRLDAYLDPKRRKISVDEN